MGQRAAVKRLLAEVRSAPDSDDAVVVTEEWWERERARHSRLAFDQVPYLSGLVRAVVVVICAAATWRYYHW